MKKKPFALGSAVLLALSLTACQLDPTPPAQDPADLGPYAGGKQYPWTDRKGTPGTNPYANGQQYPWQSPRAAGASVSGSNVKSQLLSTGENYLSDLTWTSATNAWGPIEKDQSNGQQSLRDGKPLTINGTTYTKGLGVHAASEAVYTLSGNCSTFTAQVGIDDEVGNNGSVVFQIFADGKQIYDSGILTGADAAKSVNLPVTGVNELRLVTNAGTNNYYDHADWADAKVSCTAPASNAKYLSDAAWNQATNGWGPIEQDMSNGEQGAGDGRTLTIAGRTFAKGLGMHAGSNASDYYGSMAGYTLDGKSCTRFQAQVGIDDEVAARGSVVFQVYTLVGSTKQKIYDSGVVRGGEAARKVDVDITGATGLELVVNNAGDGNSYDHADWADAQLVCGSVVTQPPGQIKVENLTAGPLPDRMVFSKVGYGNPSTPSETEHTVSKVRVSNPGTGTLTADLKISGAFQLIAPTNPRISLAPGASIEVAVRYTGEGQRLDKGQLQIVPTTETPAATTITLVGVWQSQYENNQEPTLLDIVSQTFGFKTVFTATGNVNQQGRVAPQGDELMAPYWQRADTTQPVKVSILAAYHTQGNPSTLYWHPKGSTSVSSVISNQGVDSQTILPRLKGSTALAETTFTPSAATFGLRVDGSEWSDPTSNNQTTDINHGCVAPCGQHLRFFTAKDASGAVIPNTYLLVMDYSGINYDYNDNVYLISNVRPAPLLVDTGLPAGAKTTDPSGNVWVSDRDRNNYAYFRPTTAPTEPVTAITAEIANTDFDALYRTYRGYVGQITPRTLSYRYPLENGTHTVKLHFAELNWDAPGKRFFDVKVNGQLAIQNLDIVAQSGGKYTALVIPVTATVTGGELQIDLTATVDYPSISGIEVVR